MSEAMQKFLEDAGNDPALMEALEKAASPAGVLALAREKGYALTEEDLLPGGTGELDDEDLDDVTGGVSFMGMLTRFLSKDAGRNVVTLPYSTGSGGNRGGVTPLPSVGDEKPPVDDLVHKYSGTSGGNPIVSL